MSSLLLRRLLSTAKTTWFPPCRSTSRSFSSWLLRCSNPVTPFPVTAASKPHSVNMVPFLKSFQSLNFQPVVGMKCKMVIKKRCKDCFFVRKKGRLYIYCKTYPRHKQRQLFSFVNAGRHSRLKW